MTAIAFQVPAKDACYYLSGELRKSLVCRAKKVVALPIPGHSVATVNFLWFLPECDFSFLVSFLQGKKAESARIG